jgi:hypothetical protein
MEGYSAYHTVRGAGRGGGVSVFCDQRYSSVLVEELCFCNATVESCVVKVTCDGEDIIVIEKYRPHTDTIDNFTALLSNMLHNLIIVGKKLLF